ncbi:MAG: hypothetical protein KAQ94_02955 [Arcobacteraceae bacterium]|nr:hypothetical protein [Arcobacteraceae bacterium]
MATIEDINNIDFGPIFNYELEDDAVFYALNDTSLITQELCKITNILKNLDIKYAIDENYNIQVEII